MLDHYTTKAYNCFALINSLSKYKNLFRNPGLGSLLVNNPDFCIHHFPHDCCLFILPLPALCMAFLFLSSPSRQAFFLCSFPLPYITDLHNCCLFCLYSSIL